MAIYKYPDPRHFAFLLGCLFLFLCSIKSLDPTNLSTYVSIFTGSLVLALYGIYISCNYLLWPILVVTGFLTTLSGIVLIPSAPFVFIPDVMTNWDECKEFFDEKKYNCSESDNPAAAIIENTLACYIRNTYHAVYIVPFFTTPVFYCIFILFKKSHSLIKEKTKKRLPVMKEEASDNDWVAFMGLVASVVLFFAFATRYVALFFWSDSFVTDFFLSGLGVGFCLGFCLMVVCCLFDFKKVAIGMLIIYCFYKSITNFVQGTISWFSTNSEDQLATCHNYLNALNETCHKVTSTRFFSLNLTMHTNSTDLVGASIAATSCYEAFRHSDPMNSLYPLGAALLFLFSISYLMAIIQKPTWKTTKKIIKSGI